MRGRGRTIVPGEPLHRSRPLRPGGAWFRGPDDEGVIVTPAFLHALGYDEDAPPPAKLLLMGKKGRPIEVPLRGVTEKPLPGLPQGAAGPAAGSARLVSYGDEHVVVASSSEKRSLLVLTDVAFPGWKATVDGQPAKIERVNYLMRGVVVPPGTHRVEMRYEPSSWRLGWIVSLVSLLVLIGLVVAGIRRRGSEA